MKKKDFCAVIMEVERNIRPNMSFLQSIRKFCTKNRIVLIFDECSSGFREVLGGIHKKYKVYPDLAMFSKSIGNGYPITVLAGKSEIMKESFNTFISSTYWSERIGPTAALATIKEMERIKSWRIIVKNGKYIKNKILKLSKKYKIKLIFNDSLSIINFKITGKYDHVVYKNFISQEMLKRKFICNDTIYVSVAHTRLLINKYLNELDLVFKKIFLYEKNEVLYSKLEQDISGISFFKRLN
jgi:glutamate-1-semialdehyde aminotransferase